MVVVRVCCAGVATSSLQDKGREPRNLPKNLRAASHARVRACRVESREHNGCGLVHPPAQVCECAYKEEVGGSSPSAPTSVA